jgi:hypothetical protein
MQNQRTAKRAMDAGVRKPGGGRTVLTDTNIRTLNSIGFDWGKTNKTRWNEKYQELVEFHAQYGHTNVQNRVNQPLSAWTHAQRAQYGHFLKKRPSFMTLERVQKLLQLGFQFERHDTCKTKKVRTQEEGETYAGARGM